jgi:hypothetical protein
MMLVPRKREPLHAGVEEQKVEADLFEVSASSIVGPTEVEAGVCQCWVTLTASLWHNSASDSVTGLGECATAVG